MFRTTSKAPTTPTAIKEHKTRTWPLYVLSLPAFVAIWSGWVGIGEKTGFGEVKLLPGIIDELKINTAVTLPIGLETYAAYSMYAWLTAANLALTTRRFAKFSALGSLVLGMAGQAAYHVMEALGITTAHVSVIIIVSAIPVIVMGLGIGLAHAMRHDVLAARATSDVPEEQVAPEPVPADETPDEDVPEERVAPETVPADETPEKPKRFRTKRVKPVETDSTRDERYAKGLHAYHVSKQGPGRPLSQRDLAKVMGMKNRELAIQIQKDYAAAVEAGTLDDLILRVLGDELARAGEPKPEDDGFRYLSEDEIRANVGLRPETGESGEDVNAVPA